MLLLPNKKSRKQQYSYDPICLKIPRKNGLQILSLAAYASETNECDGKARSKRRELSL